MHTHIHTHRAEVLVLVSEAKRRSSWAASVLGPQTPPIDPQGVRSYVSLRMCVWVCVGEVTGKCV